MILRPYQQEAIAALWEHWRAEPNSTPLIVCPTGAGKSLICAEIVRKILLAAPKMHILILSHRKEIIRQNADEIHNLLKIPVGVYSAGLGSKIIRQVTCANIQSVFKKPFPAQGLIIIDEAHMISESSDSMYRKFLDAQPQAKVVGLTATPYRMDRGSLVGDLFTGIAYDIPLKQLIEQGYLAPLISRPTGAPIDFSRVRKSGNDYNQEALEQTMLPHTREHCESIIANTTDRKHILVFCSGIKHAKECAELLPNADYLTGEMDPVTRDNKIRAFKNGSTRILCNVDVLTTGFNVPSVDCVVLLRATQSVGLYVQIVGRGSRLAPGKTNTLVLDYGKNIQTHGPIDLIEIRERRGSKDPQFSIPPVKACDECGAVVSIRTTTCPGCGYNFPPASCKLEKAPETASILSEPEPAHAVRNTEYKIHIKEGKPPMLRVRYWTGTTAYYDLYLCFEHAGYAQQKAIQTWKKLQGGKPPQFSTDAYMRAMNGELAIPGAIRVAKRGKYHDITHFIDLKKKEKEDLSWQEVENLYI